MTEKIMKFKKREKTYYICSEVGNNFYDIYESIDDNDTSSDGSLTTNIYSDSYRMINGESAMLLLDNVGEKAFNTFIQDGQIISIIIKQNQR